MNMLLFLKSKKSRNLIDSVGQNLTKRIKTKLEDQQKACA